LSVLAFVAAANGVAVLFYILGAEEPSNNDPGQGVRVAAIVPDVAGQDYASAKRTLEAAGFKVFPVSDPNAGRVKEHSPAPRSRTPAGETVTLQFERLVVLGSRPPKGSKPPAGSFALTTQVLGDTTLDLGKTGAKVTIELAVVGTADSKVDVAIGYAGTAKPGVHFQVKVDGKANGESKHVVIPRGKRTVTLEIVPMVPPQLQPDREAQLTFRFAAAPSQAPTDAGSVTIKLTEKLTERNLLVLLFDLDPKELPGVREGWKGHFEAWRKAAEIGEGRWAREQAFPITTPPAPLADLVDKALATRSELLRDLPEDDRNKLTTVAVWRSSKSPKTLQGNKAVAPLTADTQHELSQMRNRFVFLWYGFVPAAPAVDSVHEEVLLKALGKAWRAVDLPRAFVPAVDTNDQPADTVEALKFALSPPK